MSKPASVTAFITRIFIIGLTFALFLEQVRAGLLLNHADDAGVTGAFTLTFLVNLLAPALFLFALWAASGIFIRINRGDSFSTAVVNGLKVIGACLMLGAFVLVILQPSLLHLQGNGFTSMAGASFDLGITNLTLSLIGLLLVLVANRGEKLMSELNQFV
ncbi:MAG: DUF2975 domain-containing protein [Aquisalinus sp.]|nr:DUF2975 domain-containing protein [Aquisalinus sp.]